jgi:hypothetical protein
MSSPAPYLSDCLAALDLVSARRMAAYRTAFETAQTVPALASLARRIHTEDMENGYVTVLGEMVAGGVSDAELGGEVAARLQPWIDLVANRLRELLAGSPFGSLLPAEDVAFAVIALYLGVDMISELEHDHSRAASLLDLLERYAPVLSALLPQQPRAGPGERRRRTRPLGEIPFRDWLAENDRSIGISYANELQRHFAVPASAGGP